MTKVVKKALTAKAQRAQRETVVKSKRKRINLTLSIFLLALFACSYVYAQDQQPADDHLHKAQDLEKQGKYNEAVKSLEEAMTI
ncbi:MAG: hypothetical protein QGI15_05065, partial [Candidatus Scalindua sp.]|nr:hypothetical protein [Candidatus Scalindua sp.]